MFVYHSAPTLKIVRCSCIRALLQGRLLYVPVSLSSYREDWYMFVYHGAPTGKVVEC
jgi:hypothetical protein